jgi:threonylcarbamoyladenosine tRNA methylthiotransferase MtaB
VFGLGADVIAGFPGETEEDHRATLSLVDALPFTGLHVFPYSVRPGTAAARLGGRVPGDVVARRAAELREAGTRRRVSYEAARAGGEADVVVVGDGARREGLTEDYISVELGGPAGTPAFPRGARFRARLVPAAGGGRRALAAVPLAP